MPSAVQRRIHAARSMVKSVQHFREYEKQRWGKRKTQSGQSTRKLRIIYHVGPEEHEFDREQKKLEEHLNRRWNQPRRVKRKILQTGKVSKSTKMAKLDMCCAREAIPREDKGKNNKAFEVKTHKSQRSRIPKGRQERTW